jgi:hypothetical protein
MSYRAGAPREARGCEQGEFASPPTHEPSMALPRKEAAR